MPENGVRSTYSQAPVQLLLSDEGGIISTATGFFYSVDDSIFLITNWHVVTGKNVFTKLNLDQKNARVPLRALVKLSTWMGDLTQGKFAIQPWPLDLYEDSRSLTGPLWYEHPLLGSDCDVVAFPFSRPQVVPHFMHNSVNLISEVRIPVLPGNSAFVIGFPSSLSVGFGLPIWKHASIASEPHYDVDIGGAVSFVGGLMGGRKLPAFFLDSLTRAGMSGSPVFASFTGTWSKTDPYEELDLYSPVFWNRTDVALNSTAHQFVGIYSGRLPDQEQGAALGLCWRAEVIDLICREKRGGLPVSGSPS